MFLLLFICFVLAFLLMMFETSLRLCTTGTWILAPCRILSALLMASADVNDYHLHCLMLHSVVDCCRVVVGFLC